MSGCYVGIDPGIANMAIVATNDQGEVLDSVLFKPEGTGGERYLNLYTHLHTFVYTSRPDIVIVEGHSFGSEYSRETMGAARCIVDMVLWSTNRKAPIVIQPQTLKKFVQAKKKDQIRLEVFKRWGVELGSEHECDAYVLSQIGRHLYVRSETDQLPKYQAEVLDKISENQWAPPTASKSSRTTTNPSSRSRPRRIRRPSPAP